MNNFIDLTNNGRLFPIWVMKNFRQYKLPPIIMKPGEDPCSIKVKKEIHKYQAFIGALIGPNNPYKEALIYHGLGSGKTVTAINIINLYQEASDDYNIVILIKASLHNDPWLKDMEEWLIRQNNEKGTPVEKTQRFKSIYIVHYDSPFADKDFLDVLKKMDMTKKSMYIIEEAHNFIRNVYSNMDSEGGGKRAQKIYDVIIREKQEKKSTVVVAMTATPIINIPFELALLFNLLRPGSFPSSQAEFESIYYTKSAYPVLNPDRTNQFQRKIMGLVSYYIGATPDLFAAKIVRNIRLKMSPYHYNSYRYYEKIEYEFAEKMKKMRFSKKVSMYRSYTRQACNFVFPYVNSDINSTNRPRPKNFKISDTEMDNIDKGRLDRVDVKQKVNTEKYLETVKKFISSAKSYFEKFKKEKSILEDVKEFSNMITYGREVEFEEIFKEFVEKGNHSPLFDELYKHSPKMTAAAFFIEVSPGPAILYSNYVLMEGIEVFKIYLEMLGYGDYRGDSKKKYGEYHGQIDKADRQKLKETFNSSNNINGELVKVFLFSPSGAEGINLLNVRQIHILERYYHNVRTDQVEGRGLRQCSHSDLPMEDRFVYVFYYEAQKPEIKDDDDLIPITSDEFLRDAANSKENLNNSFLGAIKEVAVDCALFKAHNSLNSTYECFQFPQETVLTDHPGPAYREDTKDDYELSTGSNAQDSELVSVKVKRIKGVIQTEEKYSEPEEYLYDSKTGIVYDPELHFPVGKVKIVNGIPAKIDKFTYVISDVVKV